MQQMSLCYLNKSKLFFPLQITTYILTDIISYEEIHKRECVIQDV